jgi:hypothetical protein
MMRQDFRSTLPGAVAIASTGYSLSMARSDSAAPDHAETFAYPECPIDVRSALADFFR